MLAHSPPFPLIINHDNNNHDLTPEDEGGIMFALEHRDHVRCIYLEMPVPSLQKLIKAIDDHFPMLEYLYISPPSMHTARLVLPATFRAPQLSYLMLSHIDSPIGSPLLTTAVGLVRLSLGWIHPSTNLCPNHLLQALSLLPQLEALVISFSSPIPTREIEGYMLHMPIVTHTTLPNLRSFGFGGVSAYLEALLSNMDTPLLETLGVSFFNQLSFSIPYLRKFVTTTENLRSSRVKFLFYRDVVSMFMYLSLSTVSFTFYIRVGCNHLDWQVSSMEQIFNVLSPLCSAVVDLTLDYGSHTLSSEGHDQADRTHWRKLLGSFRNVEILRVHDGLVGELSRCLALDGEPPSEILPELKTLVCPVGSRDAKAFATLVDDREVAGLPVDLIEDVFPAGKAEYEFGSPAGVDYVS